MTNLDKQIEAGLNGLGATRVTEADPRLEAQAQREDFAASLTPELRRKLDIASAPAWVPKGAGDVFAGRVIAIVAGEITNDYGHQVYPKVVYETGDAGSGRFVAVHALGTAIFSQYKALGTKAGDYNIIRCNGDRRSAAGRTYTDITIIDDKPAGTGGWVWTTPDPVEEPAF